MCPLLSYENRKITRLPLNGNDYVFLISRVRWVIMWLALKWDWAGTLGEQYYFQVYRAYCGSPIAFYNTLLLFGLQLLLLPERHAFPWRTIVMAIAGRVEKDFLLKDLQAALEDKRVRKAAREFV